MLCRKIFSPSAVQIFSRLQENRATSPILLSPFSDYACHDSIDSPECCSIYHTHSRNDPYPHAGLFSKSTIAQDHPYSNNNSGNTEQKFIQEKRFSHQQLLPQPSQISILYDIKDNNQQHQPEESCRWRIIRSSQHDGCPSNQKHDKLNCSRLFPIHLFIVFLRVLLLTIPEAR